MSILVTGAAGFIGFHLSKTLLDNGKSVVGYDSVNDYYDPALKEARLKILEKSERFTFYRNDLCDFKALEAVFETHDIQKVCNLAAQAGVRYSLINPFAYQNPISRAF